MEFIEQKRKIYGHIEKSFGARLTIKTLKDLVNVETFPKADREIINLLLKTKLITGEDSSRIEKAMVLKYISELTQKFIITEERNWRDYGISALSFKNERYDANVRTIMAILPHKMASTIIGKTGNHYSSRDFEALGMEIKVEKCNELSKIYAQKGEERQLIGITENNINQSQFERGGCFNRNSFKAIPICHIRYAEQGDKIYLLETQSDIVQKKGRIGDYMQKIESMKDTMLELNKLYFEESLKIDNFDLAIGLLKTKYPTKQILMTTKETQSLIEGWNVNRVPQKFEEAIQLIKNNEELKRGIVRDVNNKYKLFELNATERQFTKIENIETESTLKKLEQKRKFLKMKNDLESNYRGPFKIVYNFDMTQIILISREFLSNIARTNAISNHPELKRIDDRKKTYKLKVVCGKKLSETWYTSEDLKSKQEYIYKIAA